MSIITCQSCTRNVDTDFDEAYMGEDGDYCLSCREELEAKQEAYWRPLYEGERVGGLLPYLSKEPSISISEAANERATNHLNGDPS